MKKSKRILKFKPIYSLKEGLKETYHWYLKNKKQSKFRKNYFTK
jgi:nucleoside-diphosphate-sugar epimerase